MLIEERGGEAVDILRTFAGSVHDPEAEYYAARHLAHVGAPDVALPILQRAVEGGYFCYPAMAADPWLDSLRAQRPFHDVLARARAGCDAAAAAFVAAGGDARSRRGHAALKCVCYTSSLMHITSDNRKRLGHKRAGRVGVCVLER